MIQHQDHIIQIDSERIAKLENNNLFNWKKNKIGTNIQMKDLLNQGYELVYDQFYSYSTTNQQLYEIKNQQCNKESIICVGGADSNDTLILVSCGSCLDILTHTTLDKPKFVNGAWWYFTPGWSFGFAPTSNIRQYFYDCYDCSDCNDNENTCSDDNRLSWKLTYNPGFRLGYLLK